MKLAMEPSPVLRDGPVVYPSGRPPGPWGSFNTDEPSTEGKDRDLSLSRTSAMEEMYQGGSIGAVLDAAFMMATTQLNPILDEAITAKIDPEMFALLAREKADDLLETCVYKVVRVGVAGVPGYDFSGIAPSGVVTFLDWFMNQNSGRVFHLETALKNAYESYLEAKLNA